MMYGYNDAMKTGVGVVHLFKDRRMFDMRKPFCGRAQHYVDGNETETPQC